MGDFGFTETAVKNIKIWAKVAIEMAQIVKCQWQVRDIKHQNDIVDFNHNKLTHPQVKKKCNTKTLN